jgi:hypothetical protein
MIMIIKPPYLEFFSATPDRVCKSKEKIVKRGLDFEGAQEIQNIPGI